MDFNQIKDLIKTIDSSKLTEFELRLDSTYVKMGKNKTDFSSNDSKGSDVSKSEIHFSESHFSETIEEPITILPEKKQSFVEGNIVKSPIVGTFYESGTPDKPPFVSVGSSVSKGDVLCIVEAMKVMNEISCDFDGQIAEIFVKDGEMVEFNQLIYRIV